jgi:hypothetical protein
MTSPCLADRFRDMTAMWHLWRAAVSEDLGEIPTGLDEAVASSLRECLHDARTKLDAALQSCESSLASLTPQR